MTDSEDLTLNRRTRARMHRRGFIIASALALALAGTPVLAQDFAADIVAQLRDLGFDDIELQRTLLGRTRILATNALGQREIIVNPNSGEILRDLWTPGDGGNATARLVDNSRGGKDGASGPDEDDDGPENGSGGGSGSAHGGGNSGSNGGNSGSNGGGGHGSNSGKDNSGPDDDKDDGGDDGHDD